eukprot:COSAG02_NODE_38111_length_433_cov_0.772455_1_plen_21_part_10
MNLQQTTEEARLRHKYAPARN